MKNTNIELGLAPSITKAASEQTFYTIRYLVDSDRVADAYRAYAYFRWVDDALDTGSTSSVERTAFLERQKSLLEECYRGESPRDADVHEICSLTSSAGMRRRTAGCNVICGI